jgi:hypothetical protein
MNMITRSLKREPLEETEGMEEDPLKSSIILNATAEFCRTLGDIPTYGMAGNRDEDEDELMVIHCMNVFFFVLTLINCASVLAIGFRATVGRRTQKKSRKRRT